MAGLLEEIEQRVTEEAAARIVMGEEEAVAKYPAGGCTTDGCTKESGHVGRHNKQGFDEAVPEALVKEAEASVALDGETQAVGPVEIEEAKYFLTGAGLVVVTLTPAEAGTLMGFLEADPVGGGTLGEMEPDALEDLAHRATILAKLRRAVGA